MGIFSRILVKDYDNVKNEKVRLRYGIVAGLFGIISNLLLFVAKIFIGLISGSVTIIADAINNLSDMGSSIVVLFGFKLSSKPADSEHPYGHARYEQIMALIVVVLVCVFGVLLAKESIEKLIVGAQISVSVITFIILGLAIVVKFVQMLVYRDLANSINSDILRASSIDSRNDTIATGSVLLAMILISVVGDIGISLDGLFGLLVSLFIIYSNLKMLKETINPLLGQSPSKEFVKELKNEILSYEGVLGIHDFLIHNYGANAYFASAHVEVSSKMDFMVAHDLIDNIEREILQQFNVLLSIHLDPIETDNKNVIENREKVEKIIREIDKVLTIHDFRMVFGKSHTNIVFDVVIPFDNQTTLKEIKDKLEESYKEEKGKFYFVITLDRE